MDQEYDFKRVMEEVTSRLTEAADINHQINRRMATLMIHHEKRIKALEAKIFPVPKSD